MKQEAQLSSTSLHNAIDPIAELNLVNITNDEAVPEIKLDPGIQCADISGTVSFIVDVKTLK